MSWREAADPRCPECGEKISPTAYYCMHCYTDLPGDVDTTDPDSTADEVLGDDEFGTDRLVESDTARSSEFDTGSSGSGSANRSGERHRVEGLAGRLVSMLGTDVPDPEGFPDGTFSAPLWMRLPVAIGVGLFVIVAVGSALSVLFGEFLSSLSGLPTLGLFVLVVWWLGRKPLPSDIVGDGLYAIALAMLVMPAALVTNELLSLWLGSGTGGTAVDAVVGGLVLQFFVTVPAVLLLGIGYLGNRYARSKLDTLAESSSDGRDY